MLRLAHSKQVSALKRIRTLRGTGTLEEWFRAPTLTIKHTPVSGTDEGGGGESRDNRDAVPTETTVDGPFEVHRTSTVSFAWSNEARSLRSNVRCVPPTIYKAIQDKKTYNIREDLAANYLVRPDGFYQMLPDRRYGEFSGFPATLFGGEPTRVVERKANEVANELRGFSYLFDPSTMFEIGGSRVDQLCERYLQFASSPDLRERLAVGRREDGSLLVTTQYVNSAGGESEPSLTVEVVLDAGVEFLPVEASFLNRNDILTQSLSWEYSDNESVVVPTRFRHTKHDDTGSRVQQRVMTITDVEVNERLSDADFALSSISVDDGDRLIDRVENQLKVIEGGVPVLIQQPSSSSSRRLWLVLANVAAASFLVLVFAVRKLRARAGKAD
ncbi:hypothetical protein Mal4_20070 [Maioricimonas rarisocia]|uniref:Uncharacterized protein n=1 Tax=Maioricimonas rarisocia TaxID=2528026 RepID=A0A517Z5G3_9PLAN|nr:hypothetical protein [Maioricimonas rarisocia]QDU37691.1 hypothetical protein Mal4_20070 [Maioricimonas rarisocia]